MMERREFPQYDISLDSQRFSALIASGASLQTIEEQKSYIERQLKSDIGERIGIAERTQLTKRTLIGAELIKFGALTAYKGYKKRQKRKSVLLNT